MFHVKHFEVNFSNNDIYVSRETFNTRYCYQIRETFFKYL